MTTKARHFGCLHGPLKDELGLLGAQEKEKELERFSRDALAASSSAESQHAALESQMSREHEDLKRRTAEVWKLEYIKTISLTLNQSPEKLKSTQLLVLDMHCSHQFLC